MYNYKSRYKMKGLSVYGEPNFSILHKLDKLININKDTSILIVNAEDGIYTLPFAKKSKYIICYEENKDLLYGGIIDNFYSVGLVNRLKCNKLDSNVIIHNSNYYEEEHQEKYDLVLSIRTIQDKVNDIYKIKEKFYKLLNSVKDNGYLYLNYYLDEDYEVSGLQKIMPKELLNLIDLSKWNIVYHRENINRKTIHNKHPYHNRKHSHKLGYLLLQKTSNIKTKRILNRTYKKGSIFGDPDQQVYDYINFFKTRYNTILDCLVVDANDGKNVFPFARNNFNVTCYEDNEILLNGGIFNHTYAIGLNKRIVDSKLNNITVKNLNYYEVKEIKKYDFVYVSLSLNLEKNKHISIKDKVRKLKSSVKVDGYLYIYYELIIDNKEKSNSYLKFNEMRTYFDLEDWQLLYICERQKKLSNINTITNGYIFARKKNNRKKYKYNFEIQINNKIEY